MEEDSENRPAESIRKFFISLVLVPLHYLRLGWDGLKTGLPSSQITDIILVHLVIG